VRYNLLRLATEPAANPSRTTTLLLLLLLLLALRFHPCRTICCYYFTGATARRACACVRVRGFALTPPRATPVLLTAACLLRRNNVSARDYARIAGSRVLARSRADRSPDEKRRRLFIRSPARLNARETMRRVSFLFCSPVSATMFIDRSRVR